MWVRASLDGWIGDSKDVYTVGCVNLKYYCCLIQITGNYNMNIASFLFAFRVLPWNSEIKMKKQFCHLEQQKWFSHYYMESSIYSDK